MNNKDTFIFDKGVIKNRVKALRKSRNLTQEQATDLVGMKDSNSWAKIESHKSSLALSFDNLIRIVNAFGVDVNFFFRSEKPVIEDTGHTETLIIATLKNFTEKEKQLALSIIMAIRANRET
ncbi:MAG: helix-turn-helix domain-containing protein [Defluviitaleaceae bacterium]|nr:helix-turn-helix domain-containing protein [Defluviitaleaceae bacterium]